MLKASHYNMTYEYINPYNENGKVYYTLIISGEQDFRLECQFDENVSEETLQAHAESMYEVMMQPVEPLPIQPNE